MDVVVEDGEVEEGFKMILEDEVVVGEEVEDAEEAEGVVETLHPAMLDDGFLANIGNQCQKMNVKQ
jgi:hypothetical protein